MPRLAPRHVGRLGAAVAGSHAAARRGGHNSTRRGSAAACADATPPLPSPARASARSASVHDTRGLTVVLSTRAGAARVRGREAHDVAVCSARRRREEDGAVRSRRGPRAAGRAATRRTTSCDDDELAAAERRGGVRPPSGAHRAGFIYIQGVRPTHPLRVSHIGGAADIRRERAAAIGRAAEGSHRVGARSYARGAQPRNARSQAPARAETACWERNRANARALSCSGGGGLETTPAF